MTASARLVINVDEIRHEYELAHTAKQSAIEHALRCGELLLSAKAALPHGEFGSWIEARCGIAYSTAARYMAAARRKSTGVEISSLSGMFPSGRKVKRSRNALPAPQEPAAAPSESPPAPPNPDEFTLDQALATIRGQTDFERKYGRLLKSERDARNEFRRAEIAHRNAVARVVAAASKLGEAAKGGNR